MTDNPTLSWVRDRNTQLIADGLARTPRIRGADDSVLDLASNDYLGLARDSRVVDAAVEAARIWGAGSTGSRLVTGTTELHVELESALAGHVGAMAGRVFSSGYLANLAAITALADDDTLIISDALNHASLIDAIRLTRCQVKVVEHRDAEAVEAALKSRSETKALVVTDALFSVDGDVAPLAALHAAATTHGAMLIVDEAHSLCVVGERGEGAVSDAGISGQPNVVQTVTLSKSLGSQGGAVLADASIIELLTSAARTFIFDTGLAPASAGAALRALQIVRDEPHLVKSVRENSAALHWAAGEIGWNASVPDGAVISLLVGDPGEAVAAANVCLELGVWVGCFRPPSVPDGVSRLRITARANLDDSDLALTVQALVAAAAEVGLSGIEEAT